MNNDVPNIKPHYYETPENVVAIMSTQIVGDIPALDTQSDVNQVALEWLPIATHDFRHLTQLIRDGKVRAEPRWSQDGRILEISLVRIEV